MIRKISQNVIAGQAEPDVQAQGIGFAIAMDTAKPITDLAWAIRHKHMSSDRATS